MDKGEKNQLDKEMFASVTVKCLLFKLTKKLHVSKISLKWMKNWDNGVKVSN